MAERTTKVPHNLLWSTRESYRRESAFPPGALCVSTCILEQAGRPARNKENKNRDKRGGKGCGQRNGQKVPWVCA